MRGMSSPITGGPGVFSRSDALDSVSIDRSSPSRSDADRMRRMHANGRHTSSGNRLLCSRDGPRRYNAGDPVRYACGHHGAIATENCANISGSVDDADAHVLSCGNTDRRASL